MRGYGQIKSSLLGGPRVFGYVMIQRDGVQRIVLYCVDDLMVKMNAIYWGANESDRRKDLM